MLQEYISPEDYEEAMKELPERISAYVREPRELSEEEIAIEAKILLTASGEELDSEELAEMMNADVFMVERALRKYAANRIGQE